MKRFLALCLAAVLALTGGEQASAVVEPETTELPAQGWMVNIYATDAVGLRSFMCKGALVAGRWVLTAARCAIYDPFRAIEGALSASDPQYVVIAAGSSTPVRVLDFMYSDDNLLGLMFLERPIATTPLRISAATESELIGSEVSILGSERSKGVRDPRFNPGSGLAMNCDIDGDIYVTGTSEGGGAYCYLMSWPETGTTLYQARAHVIDPEAPGAPDSEMDRYGGFDRSGARLYLDFRISGSHACHEDLGAPVLRIASDGSMEAVGVVAAVGMAAGLPLCGPVLYNSFSSIAHYEQFLYDSVAQKSFESSCPAVPEPELAYLEDGAARLSWPEVPGALGYRLHYTAQEGYAQISTADLGKVLEYGAVLAPGAQYRVAVSAYGESCSSQPSRPLTVRRAP